MRATRLEPGQRYGHITLVQKLEEKTKHGNFYWLCRCECGNEKKVPSGKVRQGCSCGCVATRCYQEKHIIGKRYGRLVAVERLDRVDKWGCRYYRCVCDCGNEKVMSSTNLSPKTPSSPGGAQSCGCLAIEAGIVKLPPGVSAFNSLYLSYQHNARRRSLDFNLSRDEFRQLTQKPCCYCEQLPSQQYRPVRGCNGAYTYNGVDRINPAIGYQIDNCIPYCKDCNRMKMAMPFDRFLDKVRAIAARFPICPAPLTPGG